MHDNLRSGIYDELGLPPHVAGELSRRLDASDGIAQRVDAEGALSKVIQAKQSPRPSIVPYVGIAAAIALIIAGIKYIPAIIPNPKPQYTTYSTTNGQRANITLPDGSKVTLAPATTLRISNRNVELNGEALFTVTQHSGDPFTVNTVNTVTRVLGTTFVIRAYTAQVRIAVSEGKISISDPKQRDPGQDHPRTGRSMHILDAGDVAEIDVSHTTISRNTDVSAMLLWTSGRLTFNKTPLREAIPDLNRWYDVDIHLSDVKLGELALLGPMPAGSPAELAYTLGRVLGVRVERSGKIITIYP